jgi:hypothetical protein
MNPIVPPINAHVLAQQLLDAQVEHTYQRLISPEAIDILTAQMDEILRRAEHFELNQVVSRESIRGVVRTYAFELNLGAGVLELIGAMAQRLHEVASVNAPSLKQLMPQSSIEQWIDKIIELKGLRQQLGQRLAQSQVAQTVFTQILSTIIRRQIPTWVEAWRERFDTQLQDRLPKFFQRFTNQNQQLSDWLAGQLVETLQQHSSRLIVDLSDDELRDVFEQIWYGIKNLAISSFGEGLAPLDIEEFFVLVYEDWRRLRHEEYVQRLIITGVDVFFEVYGDYSLVDLLCEVGITRQHMIGEIVRFAPPVLDALVDSGDLRELLAMQFEPFYRDPHTIALLTRALDANHSLD